MSEWVKGALHPSNAKRLYMDDLILWILVPLYRQSVNLIAWDKGETPDQPANVLIIFKSIGFYCELFSRLVVYFIYNVSFWIQNVDPWFRESQTLTCTFINWKYISAKILKGNLIHFNTFVGIQH